MARTRARCGTAVLGMTLACVALAGCEKKPEGQVVATVNGEEITRRDLASEFSAAGGKNSDDVKAIQPALVQSIVNRKLLVQEAERSNLDKNPQYLALSQRGQETLLAQMLAQTWMGKAKSPRPEDVRAFVAANPLMFGGRKALLGDTITTASASISEAQLRSFMTNDAIAGWLKANKKPFERGDKPFDTMNLPQQLAVQMVAKVGGGPIAINNGNIMNIVAVKAARDVPVPADQWTKVAQAALVQQQQMQTTQDQIKKLREGADISYLPGFAPPTPTASK